MGRTLDWKRTGLYMFKVEAVPNSCIPYVKIWLSIALYMRILLLGAEF
jgi:hypothetical protein